MKEIKAYVHANRIGELMAALKSSNAWGAAAVDEHNLTVYVVQGTLLPIDDSERHFSVELGDEVVNEYKLELVCDDGQVDGLVQLIRTVARTGQATAGWVYVTDVREAHRIQ